MGVVNRRGDKAHRGAIVLIASPSAPTHELQYETGPAFWSGIILTHNFPCFTKAESTAVHNLFYSA
jgi:hypothetical protein